MSDSRKIWVWDDDIAMMETKLEVTQQTEYVRADLHDEAVKSLRKIAACFEDGKTINTAWARAAAEAEHAIAKAEELK